LSLVGGAIGNPADGINSRGIGFATNGIFTQAVFNTNGEWVEADEGIVNFTATGNCATIVGQLMALGLTH
jgi:hypothetical protein